MSEKAPPFTILVNSCDAFRDCWHPFFTLLDTFYPRAAALPLVFNTDSQKYPEPRPHLVDAPTAMQDGRRDPSVPWSLRVDRALEKVQTPLVLYLQEDYFLTAPVRAEIIEQFAAIMRADPQIRHIGLCHFGSYGPFEATADERLWKIGPRNRYRISTQAGLWRVDTLRSYLYAPENVWMLEQFGTLRAWRRDDLFLTANRKLYGPGERIFDYLGTGVMKGQWHPDAPALFERHGIPMDFSGRGFYRTRTKWGSRRETLVAMLKSPGATLRSTLKTLLDP
jgi:hypothetical protein